MGKGYWILIWDGWGAGLVMINPRIYFDGYDMYGYPKNWWALKEGEEQNEAMQFKLLEEYKFIDAKHKMIIWD